MTKTAAASSSTSPTRPRRSSPCSAHARASWRKAASPSPTTTSCPRNEYDEFVAQATDPDDANYWDVVLDLPRTHPVRMEGPDNVYSLYEMENGIIGVLHVGRIFHPVLPGTGSGSLQVFGTEGNLIFGAGYTRIDHLHAARTCCRSRRRRLVSHPHPRRPEQGQVAAAHARFVQLLSRILAPPYRMHPGGPRAHRQRGMGPAHHRNDGRRRGVVAHRRTLRNDYNRGRVNRKGRRRKDAYRCGLILHPSSFIPHPSS